jgi:MFS family permease
MMASISKKYYQILLSQGVCSAIGVCALFQSAMNCILSWFNKKRGLVCGIVSSGSSVGGIIFPIMLSRLIQQIGYEWAMRIAAFMIMGLLIISTLTFRPPVPPKPQKMDKEGLIRPFRDTKMILIIVGYLFLTFGVFIPIIYLQIQAIDSGMQYDLAQYLVAFFNAAR